ncbi:MAG TPA: ankyrin repeat domain-containing protein, partial [Candidatus Babeliales bacterium]|nr:ankyrin repeat domain-containing protein [Candidatus Babeliales bacterium]
DGMEIEQDQDDIVIFSLKFKEQLVLDPVSYSTNASNSFVCADREHIELVNDPLVMRQIIRSKAQELEQSTEQVARQFNTAAAWKYIELSYKLHTKDHGIKQLINQGADINFSSIFLQTPLMHALLENSSVEIVKQLVSEGAYVNAQDSKGSTPLMIFVNGLSRLMEDNYIFLVNANYPNNKIDIDIDRKKEMLTVLINAASDLTLMNDKGQIALDIANSLVSEHQSKKYPTQWVKSMHVIQQLIEDATQRQLENK